MTNSLCFGFSGLSIFEVISKSSLQMGRTNVVVKKRCLHGRITGVAGVYWGKCPQNSDKAEKGDQGIGETKEQKQCK
ncbi:hypothetical protein POVCU2_0023330 [Plasmodium ovale curtisi]|uniref:Uncharacterized protein n=1 Tax=Plasmodium ovale curtisi TaxID=864141 RepID=A0A1A8VX02_PLAOA|nr:hypothetical protein POVCU2_0023330 [Plasmodium ovale curtisi]SBS91712.1 hypothetical protein POVCU1_021070 [Plasmodium ovale curtisi]